jgi:hypothetical protein
MHVAVPVAHDSLPWWHALESLQSPHSLHAAQVPPLQTMPVIPAGEHDVPAGLFPSSTQTEVPVEQPVAPVLQTFAG